jgi:hypothetical protein
MQITDGENLMHLITVFRMMTKIFSFVKSEVSLTKMLEIHYTIWEYSAYSNVPTILLPEAIATLAFLLKKGTPPHTRTQNLVLDLLSLHS